MLESDDDSLWHTSDSEISDVDDSATDSEASSNGEVSTCLKTLRLTDQDPTRQNPVTVANPTEPATAGYESDEDEADPIVVVVECECGDCPETVCYQNGYCCSKTSIVQRILKDTNESETCITRVSRFKDLILNEDNLAVFANSCNKFNVVTSGNIERRNKLFRYTSYRLFFSILELNGLGKGNRFLLPSCVYSAIERKYPSPSGNYTRFTCDDDEQSTLMCF